MVVNEVLIGLFIGSELALEPLGCGSLRSGCLIELKIRQID